MCLEANSVRKVIFMLLNKIYNFFKREENEYRFFSWKLRTGLITDRAPGKNVVVFYPTFWGHTPWMFWIRGDN